MTVLPIVGRELRVAARRRGTYWWRVISAGAALLLFGVVFVGESGSSPRSLGASLFHVFTVCFLGLSLVVGAAFTADSLSEERREGTLGLLFLTDLRGYDVVLGKLIASSLGAVYGVVAMLPVLAIPLLMGGVTGGEWGRLVLVLLNTTFFSLAAGMLVSALVRHPIWSMALTLLVVAGANLAGPSLALYLTWHYRGADAFDGLLFTSAGYAAGMVGDAAFGRNAGWFWASLGWTHLLGWLMLLYAGVRTRHGWREGGTRGAGAGAGWWRRVWLGDARRAAGFRREMLEASPCAWLTARHTLKMRLVWLVLAVVALLWLVGAARVGSDWITEGYAWLLTALLAHTILRWWVAAEAVQSLGPDRRSGALELILTTPLSLQEVVRGYLAGLQRVFLGPSIAVASADVLLMAFAARYGVASETRELFWVILLMIVVFGVDMVALAFMGLWLGVTFRQARWAFLATVGCVLGLPWFLLCCLLVLLAFPAFRYLHLGFEGCFWGYALVSLGISLAALQWARNRLLHQLRSVVAVPAAARSPASRLAAKP